MPRRHFRAGRLRRSWMLLAFVAWLASAVSRWLLGPTPGPFITLTSLAIGILLAAALVQTWAWQISVEEDGVRVDPGLGATRFVPWHDVRDVRVDWPRAIERHDSPDLRLGGPGGGPPVTAQQARELREVIRQTKSG